MRRLRWAMPFDSDATHITADAEALLAFPDIEVIVEATGVPAAGIRHASSAIAHGKHVVMVTVEADALAGPLIAAKAKAAGVVYSLAWGDQPALICEHVDWARACGFKVVAAGKGTRYEPHYHASTPETVWDILDKYLHIEDRASINPKMFNSFIDGSKSAIEMTAVCNATGLAPQSGGLALSAGQPVRASGRVQAEGRRRHARAQRRHRGGLLGRPRLAATCRIISRSGTYVVIEADSDYTRAMLPRVSHAARSQWPLCGALPADPHDWARAWHLGCLGGAAQGTDGVPKRMALRRGCGRQAGALRAGEVLDGEGGFCVWGRQGPAERSLARGAPAARARP